MTLRGLALSALLLAACSGGPSAATASIAPTAPATAATSPAPATASQSADPTFAADATPRSFARIALDAGGYDGVITKDLRLELGPSPGKGSYSDPYGRTVSDERGTWVSDPVRTPFAFDELIASWRASTPNGTWIDVQMRASGASRTTKWYTLAVWSSGDDTIHRTTVKGQQDGDGRVNVDTFEKADGAPELTSYELRVTLHRAAGITATPSVSFLAAVVSRASQHTVPSAFGGVARDLDVPMLSQETHAGHYPEYDGGGEAWCSPTSTAMVLGFWKAGPSATDLAVFPGNTHADGRVDHAARFTYDWSYSGAGNWPYNTAYAASYGLDGFITRLRSLREAELFIEAGIPLVASISGVLPGFLFTSTNGHLLVIRGFAANGDVITNDPAVRANAQARKVYPRADFERIWLGGSTGTVYVIHPPAVRLPANVGNLPPNW
ncbi:MAG TPA: C39 family peptidase [Candidatus Limnocylindria bacterium]|nr:C39 family peptidase [Candidatus Limnocylindria bacterium]